MATKHAAIALVTAAKLRQRRAVAARRTTLELSTGATGSTISTDGGGGDARGSTSGACGSESPIAVRIFSQTSARGSTDPTIWFRTPSLCSHASTIAVKSLSTDIMAST